MHFCMTAQYTPKALNGIMENPTVSRYEAAKKLIEAAGGKLISMYSTASRRARRSRYLRCARSQLQHRRYQALWSQPAPSTM